MRPTHDGRYIRDGWGLPVTFVTLEMDEVYSWRTLHLRWTRPTHDGHYIRDGWGLNVTEVTWNRWVLQMTDICLNVTELHERWLRPTRGECYLPNRRVCTPVRQQKPVRPQTIDYLRRWWMDEAYLWQRRGRSDRRSPPCRQPSRCRPARGRWRHWGRSRRRTRERTSTRRRRPPGNNSRY